MRAFSWFILLILAALAAMAVLTYPVWLWLHAHYGFPFHRVADRIGLIALAIGVALLARRLHLTDRASFGYGAPRALFLRELALAFMIGAPLMAVIVTVILGLGLRQWKPQLIVSAPLLAHIALTGLARGFAVALIEESFLRGAMFTAIARESGARLAVLLTALIYAASHFVAQYHVDAAQVGWSSGLVMLGGALSAFAHPLSLADAFLALFAVGVVLGMVRALTGHIGACIGLHASWVWVITFARETSVPDAASPLSFLVSRFDGVVGWLVLAWTVLAGVGLYFYYSRRGAAALMHRGG